MKISISEYNRFKATPHHPALRYGQAWHNHFKIYQHTPASEEERILLDRIYNEPDRIAADKLITTKFIDWEQ